MVEDELINHCTMFGFNQRKYEKDTVNQNEGAKYLQGYIAWAVFMHMYDYIWKKTFLLVLSNGELDWL